MLDLTATPDNPIPPGAKLLSVATRDGRRLRAASFAPAQEPRGTVAVFQGRAEFIEKYFETIGELLTRGFHVVTLDWRGQGGSERELANPRKGHIDDFSFYQRDLQAFVAQVLAPSCKEPWFALAHSMGGAILLEQAHLGNSPFQRMVLTAPLIDIAGLRFPSATRAFADALDMLGLGAMYIPGGTGASLLDTKFEANKLTTDRARLSRNAGVLAAAPELALGDPTVGWINAAFRQIQRFASSGYAQNSRTPTLLVACGRDQIVANRPMERFAQRLDTASLVVIPGAQHEILMERDQLRAQFWAAFDVFVPGTAVEESRAAE